MKKLGIHIALMAACLTAGAQDPHFSQYANLPLYLNPAHTGIGIEHVRMTAVYRNQWPGVSTPFTTQGLFVDKRVGHFGFGMQVFKNGAGAASIQRIDLGGMMAYHLPVGREGTLSGGLQVGMMNKKFNPDALTFDNQYVEDSGFDPSLPHGEIFSNTSITRPDLTFGLVYQYGNRNPRATFRPFGGVSFAHLNRPDEVFIAGDNRMPIRQTWHAGAGVLLNKSVELRPLVVYMRQQQSSELFAGAIVAFLSRNDNAFQAGLFLRNRDAAVAYAGYQVNRLFIGTSYDFNISSLNEATGGHGALEFTVSYSFRKKHKGKPSDPAEIIVEAPAKKKEKVAPLARREGAGLATAARTPEYLEGRDVAARMTPVPDETATAMEPESKVPAETTVAPTPPVEKPAPQTPSVPRRNIRTVPTIPTGLFATAGTPDRIASRDVTMPEPPVLREETQPLERMETRHETVPAETAEPAMESKPVMAHAGILFDETPAIKSLVDTDGDGISDAEDECPYIKGEIGTHGCPDADHDGVVDMKDRCPMEPGTAANRGCPETEPAYAQANLIRNFNNIEFNTGSAVIKTTDLYDIVEYAIDILYANPQSRIILTGHTDSEGDALSNMALSAHRTSVVSRYLQRQGIAPSRIQVINYGEAMPLMDNSDAYGKARNRRVEINIVRN